MAEEIIIVQGNNTLAGDVAVAGAKNSALKLIAAALLGQGETAIHNVPLISDISIMSDVLRCLGAQVTRDGHTLVVDTSDVDKHETPYELVSKMRASISVLGPLVGRFGRARVAMPGGCQIGARKIDMHLVGLEAIGVEFSIDHGFLEATTPNGLHGAHVLLDFPSVGATENLLMAAVVAEGVTVIENAAREPEIVDLANMLVAMGARVTGAGSAIIEVEGVELSALHPCEHTTVGDRIEAGTFLAGGALTGGPVTVHGHRSVVSAHGAHEVRGDGLRRRHGRRLDHRRTHPSACAHRFADVAAPWLPHRPPGPVHAAGRVRRRHVRHHRERVRESLHVRQRAHAHGRRHRHRGSSRPRARRGRAAGRRRVVHRLARRRSPRAGRHRGGGGRPASTTSVISTAATRTTRASWPPSAPTSCAPTPIKHGPRASGIAYGEQTQAGFHANPLQTHVAPHAHGHGGHARAAPLVALYERRVHGLLEPAQAEARLPRPSVDTILPTTARGRARRSTPAA